MVEQGQLAGQQKRPRASASSSSSKLASKTVMACFPALANYEWIRSSLPVPPENESRLTNDRWCRGFLLACQTVIRDRSGLAFPTGLAGVACSQRFMSKPINAGKLGCFPTNQVQAADAARRGGLDHRPGHMPGQTACFLPQTPCVFSSATAAEIAAMLSKVPRLSIRLGNSISNISSSASITSTVACEPMPAEYRSDRSSRVSASTEAGRPRSAHAGSAPPRHHP